jgi:uncharacterized protein YkwD
MSIHRKAQLVAVGQQSGALLSPRNFSARLRSPAQRQRIIWIEVSLAITVMLLGLLSLNSPAQAQATPASPMLIRSVFLPMLMGEGEIVDPGQKGCELSAEEQSIIDHMIQADEQGRDEIHCNPILARVARARAADMAARAYFSHVNPDGHGPNYMVAEAGFELPSWYDHRDSANNLESIGGGYSTPDNVWSAWMSSPNHRVHLLGANSFYADQHEVGVGFANDPDSPFGQYWVVITAPSLEE